MVLIHFGCYCFVSLRVFYIELFGFSFSLSLSVCMCTVLSLLKKQKTTKTEMENRDTVHLNLIVKGMVAKKQLKEEEIHIYTCICIYNLNVWDMTTQNSS